MRKKFQYAVYVEWATGPTSSSGWQFKKAFPTKEEAEKYEANLWVKKPDHGTMVKKEPADE